MNNLEKVISNLDKIIYGDRKDKPFQKTFTLKEIAEEIVFSEKLAVHLNDTYKTLKDDIAKRKAKLMDGLARRKILTDHLDELHSGEYHDQ